MGGHGFGNVADRAFVAFNHELEEGAWNEVVTKDHEDPAKQNATLLLMAPRPVVWKIRLRWGIAGVLAALGAPSLVKLDDAWDASQRRLFHHTAIGVDSDNAGVRSAADRLRNKLLDGTGIGQTQLSYDSEVDFGRNQIALTQEGAPYAADAKKAKLTDALADVHKTTEALAQALGRSTGEKRKAPSRQLREALGECAAAFNVVYDEIAWFVSKASPGAERDRLVTLLAPLDALLERVDSGAAASPPVAPIPGAETP